MNTPRVEVSIPGLSGQPLLTSLVAMFQSRANRFAVRTVYQEDILCQATVEDLRGDPPQWPVCLETIQGKLMGYIAGAFDPKIGSEIYEKELLQTIYVWLSLFDAEGEADAEHRKVILDRG